MASGDLEPDAPQLTDAELREILSTDVGELEIGCVLGSGHFSTVLLARQNGSASGELLAVKRQERIQRAIEPHMLRELLALRRCSHPNVLRLVGAMDERCGRRNVLWILTEFAPGGDLLQLITSGRRLGWRFLCGIALGAARGVQHLHQINQIHRDIKSSNLLLMADWTCKVADLGMARAFNHSEGMAQKMTICGTEPYMAPELIFDENYDGKVDIFGIGLVLFELLARRAVGAPAEGEDGGFLARSPMNRFTLDEKKLRDAPRDDAPAGLVELAVHCVSYVPDERPDADVLVDWLEDVHRELGDGAAAAEDRLPVPATPVFKVNEEVAPPRRSALRRPSAFLKAEEAMRASESSEGTCSTPTAKHGSAAFSRIASGSADAFLRDASAEELELFLAPDEPAAQHCECISFASLFLGLRPVHALLRAASARDGAACDAPSKRAAAPAARRR